MKRRLLLSLFLSAVASVQADTWPKGPIKFVVPYAPGGITDTLARSVGDSLAASLGVPVVYDYKPGGTGSAGANYVTKSSANGQTFLFISNSVITSSLLTKVSFNAFDDLVPVSLLTISPMAIVVDSNLPVNNFEDFVRLAQENPGKINYATSGIGSITHLTMEKAQQQANFSLTHVPYKGQSEIWRDFLGGRLDALIDTPAGIEKYRDHKRVKVIAFSSKNRLEYMPDVQTLAESKIKGFTAHGGFLLLAPKNTGDKIIKNLSSNLSAIVNSTSFKDKFIHRGMISVGSTPEAAAAFLKSEYDTWKKVADRIY